MLVTNIFLMNKCPLMRWKRSLCDPRGWPETLESQTLTMKYWKKFSSFQWSNCSTLGRMNVWLYTALRWSSPKLCFGEIWACSATRMTLWVLYCLPWLKLFPSVSHKYPLIHCPQGKQPPWGGWQLPNEGQVFRQNHGLLTLLLRRLWRPETICPFFPNNLSTCGQV